MKTIWFLYKKNLKNRVRRAVRKPVTYVYLALILLYLTAVPFSIYILLSEMGWQSPDMLAALITVIAFWLIPANLVSYARRKGLIFRPGDVHLLFPSPVSPKMILLYAHIKTLTIYVLVGILVALAGIFIFRASLWQVGAYFAVSMILQNLLEGSLMILLYGSEKLGEKGRGAVRFFCYGVIGVFVLIALAVYLRQGLSMESILGYLHGDAVQMVPVVGWYIALVHLIMTGPTAVNLICSALYLVCVAAALCLALRMPCSGDYFEDAMKFAEDYEELRQKKRDGEVARLGRKEKYKAARVSYKGGGAKAIFYKQLLEYKKSRFFFFDSTTIILTGVSVFLAYTFTDKVDMAGYRQFIIPGVMMYMVFCMSSVQGKWGKELKSPYTFLIPDTSFRKLWYATLLEHVKSVICGALLAVPCGIILQLPVSQVALSIPVYVCLMACKLYSTVLTEALVGNILGRVGKQLFQMLLQGIVSGVGIAAAVVGVTMFTLEAGYLIMILLLVLETAGLMAAATGCFQNAESAG